MKTNPELTWMLNIKILKIEKSTLDGINGRLDTEEGKISKLEA